MSESYKKPAESKPKKSLIAKLADACDSVGGVDKKGTNDRQGYKYVRAADVAKAIRHELFTRGILLIADEKEIKQEEIQTNAGGKMRHLTLTVQYTLYDGESGESLTSTAFGIAMDSGDKAIYKAKTGALKYFLRGLGIIPDEKDDPEADEKVDIENDARIEKQWNEKTEGQRHVAEFQIRAFNEACSNTHKTAAQIADFLKIKFGAPCINDVMRKDFNEAIKWASQAGAKADLTDDIAISIRAANERRKREKAPGPQPITKVLDQPVQDEVAGD